MKVKVSQKTLAGALAAVARVASKRATLPVLANVFVAAHDGQLQLTTTDLDVALTVWVKATVDEEGSTTVPAQTFADLVKSFPNDLVELTLVEATETLKARCGSSRTQIKGMPADEFPPVAVPDESGVKVSGETFREMVRQVVFAVSTDDARPVLTGVHVKVDGGQITMAAVDGVRLSVRTAELEDPAQTPFAGIVPVKALTEMAKIVSDDDDVTIIGMNGQIAFQSGDIQLVSRLIEGQYPDYVRIIPQRYWTRTVVPTEDFLKACKQAEIFARESALIGRLNITPGKAGKVEISGQSDETGSTRTVVEGEIEGDPILIGFNVRFLRDVLNVIDTPTVALETTTPDKPGVLRAVGNDEFVHVIMPMHLNDVAPPIKNAAEA